MIRTEKLIKMYSTEEIETTALNEVSIEVNEGEFVSITGPSGCGKSTLLASICGMLDPGFSLSGTVSLNGRCLNGIDMEHRRVGILFQDDLLFPHMDIAGNLAFAIPSVVPKKERKKRIREVLKMRFHTYENRFLICGKLECPNVRTV